MDDQAVLVDISSLSKFDQIKLRSAFAAVACSRLAVEDLISSPWKVGVLAVSTFVLLYPIPGVNFTSAAVGSIPGVKFFTFQTLNTTYYLFSPTDKAKRGRQFVRDAVMTDTLPHAYAGCIIAPKDADGPARISTRQLFNSGVKDVRLNLGEIKNLIKAKAKEIKQLPVKVWKTAPELFVVDSIRIDPLNALNNFELKM